MTTRLIYIMAALLAASVSYAQDGRPINAIEWLDDIEATPVSPEGPPVQPIEPASARQTSVPNVEVIPLDRPAARRVGLVPQDVTGLPDTLWMGSEADALAEQIQSLPYLDLPALQQLAFTVLLAEAAPPKGNADAFDLARIDLLLRYGALDPAMALLAQAGIDRTPDHFARAMEMALIQAEDAPPCSVLRSKPFLAQNQGHRVFCEARLGNWDTAALILGNARALELLTDAQATALERFLDPELFEGAADLPTPETPDPLMFRVFAAGGQPIPTRSLPVVFANADLSDSAGWKTQIEAAERLARSGTMSSNRLLGLYSNRRAAASGSVWDRVQSVQRFETALRSGSSDAISKTLPRAWKEMSDSGLHVQFADLFYDRIPADRLSGRTADLAYELLLLSPAYETAQSVFPARAARRPVLTAIARGEVPASLSGTELQNAALRGFSTAQADADIVSLASEGALGSAILRVLALAHTGSKGDVVAFSTALATMRTLGLEDMARRTAIQTLLIEGR